MQFRLRKSNGCKDSLEKLEKIYDICSEINVHSSRDGVFKLPIEPSDSHKYTNLLIYPLLSWYHPSFSDDSLLVDENLDALGTDYQSRWLDFRKITWPEPYSYRSISFYFLEENLKFFGGEDWNPTSNDFIISVSHFLPRFELVPKISRWQKPSIAYVVGCKQLDQQIRELQSDIHICGHTHIDHDVVIKNVRYVQHAMGHPTERSAWWKSSAAYTPKTVAFL